MICFHVIACIDANIIRQCFVFHQAPRQELLGFGSRIDARRFACKVLKETVDHKHKFQSTTLYVWRRIDSGMQTNKVLQVSVYQDLSGFISNSGDQLDVSGSSFHLPNHGSSAESNQSLAALSASNLPMPLTLEGT